jgi:hypothetical protein
MILKKNHKYVWVIEYWILRFICNLVLGIWDFRFWTADCGFVSLFILGTLVHFRHFRHFA